MKTKLMMLCGFFLVIFSCTTSSAPKVDATLLQNVVQSKIYNIYLSKVSTTDFSFSENVNSSVTLDDKLYYIKVRPEAVQVYAPFPDKNYSAMTSTSSRQDVMFTSANYTYNVTSGKNGSWIVEINPENNERIKTIKLEITKDAQAEAVISHAVKSPVNYLGYLEN